jgi:hypothetical protein
VVQRSRLGLSVKPLFNCSTPIGGRKGLTMVDGLLGPTLDRALPGFRLGWIRSMARGMISPFLGICIWLMC